MIRNTPGNDYHTFLAASGEANLLESAVARLKQMFSRAQREEAKRYRSLNSALASSLAPAKPQYRITARQIYRLAAVAILFALFATLLAVNFESISHQVQSGNFFGIGGGGESAGSSSCGTN